MIDSPRYPFSDLTRDQVDRLIAAARAERSRALRAFLAGLFRRRRQGEAQARTPQHALALGFKAHC